MSNMALVDAVTTVGSCTGLHRSKSKAVIVHPEFEHTLPSEPVKLSFWESCDDHVLINIARRLDCAQSLLSLQLVNRRCRFIASDEQVWRALCLSRYNCPSSFERSGSSWRELYKFNHETFKYLLAQTAAEALVKLGIRATSNNYVFNVHGSPSTVWIAPAMATVGWPTTLRIMMMCRPSCMLYSLHLVRSTCAWIACNFPTASRKLCAKQDVWAEGVHLWQ